RAIPPTGSVRLQTGARQPPVRLTARPRVCALDRGQHSAPHAEGSFPDRPWLARYDPGVPPSLKPYPDCTLLEYVAEHADRRPDHTALLFKGARLSYGELDRLSDAFAVALAALGVKRGDRVGLLLPNCPQFVIAELAAWKLAAIVAPLNPTHTERELEEPIRAHGVETIVTLTRFYGRVKRVQRVTSVKRVVATN